MASVAVLREINCLLGAEAIACRSSDWRAIDAISARNRWVGEWRGEYNAVAMPVDVRLLMFHSSTPRARHHPPNQLRPIDHRAIAFILRHQGRYFVGSNRYKLSKSSTSLLTSTSLESPPSPHSLQIYPPQWHRGGSPSISSMLCEVVLPSRP